MAAGRFWQPEEQKEEKDYQHRPRHVAFFSTWTYEMSYVFSEALKKNYDFQQVYRKGKSYANKYLVMYVLENHSERNRLGISVSKRVGNSVVRHRVTRLIRESYRLRENIFNSGLDIVVIARNSASTVSCREIESALLHLAKLHQVLRV